MRKAINCGRLGLPTLLVVSLFQVFVPLPVHGGRIIGSVGAGLDSFTEKYSVVEADTLDRLTEFRTRLNIGYLGGNRSRSHFRVEGQGLVGEESTEASGKLTVMYRPSRSHFALTTEVTRRAYRENSSYSFPNDLLRSNVWAYFQRVLTSNFSIRLTDRLEWVDFEKRTEFDYDYVRNHIELSAALEHDYTTSYRGALGFASKSIPDSTEISYRALTGLAEYRNSFGIRRQLFLAVNGERRVYNDELVKSPYWAVFSNATIAPFTLGNVGMTIDVMLEGYFYDEDRDAFFDYVENRSSLIFFYFRDLVFTCGAGPTYGFLASGFSEEDAYSELGVKFTTDYSGSRLWVSGSYEIGNRDYRADLTDTSAIVFSDFTYHRILLFASVSVWEKTSLNLFVNHEPEDHKIEGDDLTTTLFSLDLSYSF